jgi:predicted negative regulator of RcsB-dependent stress response
MARVYISSTVADLAMEREAVMEWLVAANHQPVHSYRPNSETVRESCLNDIDTCDLYVLILGHRYGFQPEEDNPEKLSITHLEFRRASKIPRIALLRTNVPDIRLSDLNDPERSALVRAFDKEVRSAVRPAEFHDLQGLIQGLSTGVQSELDKLSATRPVIAPDDPAVLRIVATLTDELDRKNRMLDKSAAEGVTLRGRIRELEGQLQGAIARTLTAAAQPDAGEAAIAAAGALETGDTRPAEALLSSQESEEAAQIGLPGMDDARQRREAGALARQQGALALGHNIRAALGAYQRAAEYEPDDTWTQFFIGDLHVRIGDLSAAMRSFRRGGASAEFRLRESSDDSDAQRNLSVSQNRIGDVLLAQGNGPAALAAYRKGLAIAEALAARDPANAEWQRDVSVSQNKIGDVLVAQGDGPAALAAYRGALAIAEALAARDPANTKWQRDVSVSQNKVGDVLVAHGDAPAALAAYRKGLQIVEVLAAGDPTNTEWQRDLSVSHDRIGTVLMAQGDNPAALAAFRKGLAIREALAARDPANTEWQRDLSVSHNKIGDVLLAQGDRPAAKAAYRNALKIAEALAGRDPSNTQWQRDLSVSHGRIGNVLLAEGDGRRALAAFRDALAIGEALALRDPANTEWQRDVAVNQNKVADVLLDQGDRPAALAAYRNALAIAEALALRDPSNTQWQRDVAFSCSKLGTLAHEQDEDVRRDYLLRGREIIARLKSEGRLTPSDDWTDWFDARLAELPTK